MRILLKICYLGTRYRGFQVQSGQPTVQSALQDAAEAVFGLRCPVTGCGRTDSGVHANEYFCLLDTSGAPNGVPIENIADALNHSLPRDIAVWQAASAPPSFHPRYSVREKHYLYKIWNERAPNPFYENRAFHYPRRLDPALMDRAAGHFIGKHDFRSFMAAGSETADTVREIFSASVTGENGFIDFRISGSGFLYNMVRIMAGTLIYVSEGKIAPEAIPGVIDGKSRKNAGFTAPAHGLYLDRVVY